MSAEIPLVRIDEPSDPSIAVEVEELGKVYRVQFQQRGVLLREMVLGLLSIQRRNFQALEGISFRLPRGEALGVIGPNGSGKTTLLKIICGLSNRNAGRLSRRGRTVGMIELGAGFQPELTGRENIHLFGLVLGLSGREIREREGAIAEFAGLGEFLDAPVKTYSAGMSLRLGFACAVHADPEVLVVDEVIEVGDATFKDRCFDRIRELRSGGTSLVLATHATDQVRRYCDHMLHIDSGRMVALVNGRESIERYLDELFGGKEDDSLRETLNYQSVTAEPGKLMALLTTQREMLRSRLPTLEPAEREALLRDGIEEIRRASHDNPDQRVELLGGFVDLWLELLELVDGSTLLKLWEPLRHLLRELLPIAGTIEQRVGLLGELQGFLQMEPGPIKVTFCELRDILRAQLAERINADQEPDALALHHGLLDRLDGLTPGGSEEAALSLEARLVEPKEGHLKAGDQLVVEARLEPLDAPTSLVVELALFSEGARIASMTGRRLAAAGEPVIMRFEATSVELPDGVYRLVVGVGVGAPDRYSSMPLSVNGGRFNEGQLVQLAGTWS